MLGGTSLRVAVVGAIATLGLTTGVAPAVAADAGTWRIAYAGNRPTGYDELNTVVATGPADAWAFGGTVSIDGGQRAPGARHWNGRSWTAATLPDGLDRRITASGATGPRNVWAFAGGDEAGDAYAIRWDGRRWTVAQRWPGDGILSSAAVLSARDVWVFGSPHVGPSVGTWHYDGRTWTQAETPFGVLATASAVASDDIWAVGTDNFGIDNVLARWDGHTWTKLDVPGLPQEENHFAELKAVYAASSQDVWIVGDEYQTSGDAWSYTPLALHFDGNHWQRLPAPPAAGDGALVDVKPDGHGGVWITPDVPEPYDGPELLHYADGQWTAVRPQRPDGKVLRVHDVTTVPHSGSTWAVGEVFPPDRHTSDGAVWVNGPLPR
jgi:hypothetical protein